MLIDKNFAKYQKTRNLAKLISKSVKFFGEMISFLGIHGRIPGRASSDPLACLMCSLEAALPLLSSSPDTLNKILVVTSAELDSEFDTDTNDPFHTRPDVPVYAIAFRSAEFLFSPDKKSCDFLFFFNVRS